MRISSWSSDVCSADLIWYVVSLDPKVAFFFGQPLEVWGRIWSWCITNGNIYRHLWVTLAETVLAFFIGTVSGLGFGLWLGLSSTASAILQIGRESVKERCVCHE